LSFPQGAATSATLYVPPWPSHERHTAALAVDPGEKPTVVMVATGTDPVAQRPHLAIEHACDGGGKYRVVPVTLDQRPQPRATEMQHAEAQYVVQAGGPVHLAAAVAEPVADNDPGDQEALVPEHPQPHAQLEVLHAVEPHPVVEAAHC